jgi:hypothetical protein
MCAATAGSNVGGLYEAEYDTAALYWAKRNSCSKDVEVCLCVDVLVLCLTELSF